MKNKLLLKMFLLISVGTVVLFWMINLISEHTETRMSLIDDQYQQEIIQYGKEAERLYLAGDSQALSIWLAELQVKENTWAAVVEGTVTPYADSTLSPFFLEGYGLGRRVEWMIHLYFASNPIMEVPFQKQNWFFLIQLPQRMRPGEYQAHADVVVQVAIPFVLLCILSWFLYQQVMHPLRTLEKATRAFSDGDYTVRARPLLVNRNDEFTHLADSFDRMATRTEQLITVQRELLENLSHELRTPLSRLELAVDSMPKDLYSETSIDRLRNESTVMRELVEDTLMLVWLSQEQTDSIKETLDVSDLVDVICEDARFEFPDHIVLLTRPEHVVVHQSNQRALGQALENIIRNALQHTPKHKTVSIMLQQQDRHVVIQISDQGKGVPDHLLEDIFKPFYQVDSEQSKKRESLPVFEGQRHQGFGLGLALAKRQIALIQGSITASNIRQTEKANSEGLRVSISLPVSTSG